MWEGADDPEVFAVGHSHRAALIAAMRSVNFKPTLPAAVLHGAPGARQAPDDEYWERACAVRRGAPVAIVWSGNQHSVDFLFMPTPPFTLWTSRDFPGRVVPVEMVREFFSPTFRGLDYLLGRMTGLLRPLLVGTPPPKREALLRARMEVEPLLRKLIVEHGCDAESAPLTPGSLRVALWEVLQGMLADAAAKHGVPFVPVPDEARDSDGFIRDDLSAPDATHANQVYGGLMWAEIESVIATAGASRA